MICRLCLIILNEENCINLFKINESSNENLLIKLIAKYFNLELTPNDSVSTNICEKCCKYLKEFNEFCSYVNEKQSTLRNNIFMAKNDAEFSISTDIEDGIYNETEEVILLDMKNELIQSANSTPIDILAENQSMSPEPIKLTIEEISSSDESISLDKLRIKVKSKQITKTRIKTSKGNDRYIGVRAGNLSMSKEERCEEYEKKIKEFFIKLNCDLCQMPVDTYRGLNAHFKTHHSTVKAYMKCCNKTFTTTHNLIEHINWHRNPELFKCNICNKHLCTKNYLKMHMDTCHGINDEKTIACHICSKKFRSQKCMQNHKNKHNCNKYYNCDLCNKSFLTTQRLRRHIESVHENIYPHICETCGKKFKFKPSFEKHILEHQGIIEPPEQCNICGEWSKNKHSLRLHRFKHDKNVECHICGRVCKSKTALVGHIRYIHNTKLNLKCDYCEKIFKVPRNLEEHMATHTGTQLYSCPHCFKESRSRSNMYKHIKQSHAEEWLKSKLARSNDPNIKKEI